MKLFPAIDIKDGKCVRLKQGLFNEVTVYSEHPYEIAMEFEKDGADYIHLVDLDGSVKGRSVNAAAIREIVEHVNIPVELGGGIRTIENIKETLELGVDRVIIGTKACENPEFVREAIEKFGPDKVVVGIDAKDGYVAIKGWEELSDTTALSLAAKMKEMGVKTIIYTDISKDGMLVGPNVEKTKELSDATGLSVVASGGMSSIDDLVKLDNENIYGAIIGKAIYEKKIVLKDAVAMFKKPKFSFADFKLNSDGLIPVVVQDYENLEVLMVAYMNEEAYNLTIQTGVMTYFSRSRQSLWKKGETSGHYQYVKSIEIDCDNDTLLAKVEQIGAACHTGNRSCFYRNIIKNN